MLLKKKSPYINSQQQKQPPSLTTPPNKEQINQCILQISQTKYLQENMLNKLLRPPVKKQSKIQLKKYDPQFQKPDVEKLIHQNCLLKSQIMENTKLIIQLRFKVKEMDKKIGKLQLTCSEQLEDVLEKNKKNTSAHTQILKKKIHQLHTKYIQSESQIKRLKKLPGASIYEQNNIEKQHLLAETIRLKSILTSYETSNQEMEKADIADNKQKNVENCASSLNNAKFQQQFLRMLKEQNQKLKATIRLLQNDKILMKARQTTQNKLNTDLKKQLQQSKTRLTLKQAQIQKLTHQNQNLLFKKASKFRLQKEQKQNKQIQQLSKHLQQLRHNQKKLQNQKNQLYYDNQQLKKKEQDRSCQLIEKDKELEKIKIEIAEIKNQYDARIKSLQMNKLYSKESSFGRSSKDGRFQELRRFGVMDHDGVKAELRGAGATGDQDRDKKKFNWGKIVKYEELDFCLVKLWALKQHGIIQSFDEIVAIDSHLQGTRTKKNSTISFQQFYQLLKEPPVQLPQKQCLKLSKYIFSDHSMVPQGQKSSTPIIQTSLLITIIKASISKFIECLQNDEIIQSWKFLLQKSKKFMKELQQFVQQGKIRDKKLGKEFMTKDDFINIVVRNKTNGLLFEEINFVIAYAFSIQHSQHCIVLNKGKVLELMHRLMGDTRNCVTILGKNIFAQLMTLPKSNKNSILQKYTSIAQKIPSQSNNLDLSKLKHLPRLSHDIEEPNGYKKQKNKENIWNMLKTHQPIKTNFYKKQESQIQKSKKKEKMSKLITITQSESDIEEVEEHEPELIKGESKGEIKNQEKVDNAMKSNDAGISSNKNEGKDIDQKLTLNKKIFPEINPSKNDQTDEQNTENHDNQQNDSNIDIELSSLLDANNLDDDLSALITGSINQEDGESGAEDQIQIIIPKKINKIRDSEAFESQIISGESQFNIDGVGKDQDCLDEC